MNSGSRSRYAWPPAMVARMLVDLQEVVVEVEDPDVPVRDEVQLRARRVRVRVGAEQREVHAVEASLGPDFAGPSVTRRAQDAHLVRPRLGVDAGRLEVRVQARRPGDVELRELEWLCSRASEPT